MKRRPVRLFVSYSHIDGAWFGKLRPLLKFNPRTDLVDAWHDQELEASDRWDKKIRAELEEMDVFVCLVSYDFLASDYIKKVEVKRALAREKENEVAIVPILLYPMDLKTEHPKLNAFNPLPGWGKCWREYEQDGGHYQDAHKPIRNGLRQAIDKVRSKRP